MRHVIKRHGVQEPYDAKKVYGSVYAAAINCHYSEHEAERLAEQVVKRVNKWIKDVPSADSEELKRVIVESLPDENVAHMYRDHLDVC